MTVMSEKLERESKLPAIHYRLDQFEGQTWKGWNHYVAVVLLTYEFIATQRAEHSAAAEALPPFSQVARALVIEAATQTAQQRGLARQKQQRSLRTSSGGTWIGEQPPK